MNSHDLPRCIRIKGRNFLVTVTVAGKRHYLGTFASIGEAVEHRDKCLEALENGWPLPPRPVPPALAAPPKPPCVAVGVVRRGPGLFDASARHAGLTYRLGSFSTHEAAQAAIAAFRRKHGRNYE